MNSTFSSKENIRFVEGQSTNNSNPQSPVSSSTPYNEKLIETVLKQNASKNMTGASSHPGGFSLQAPNLSRELIQARLNKIDETTLESHLKLGAQFKFRIIIVEIAGISSDFSDIFCQFNFMHRNNEAFSTEPIQNSGKGPPLGFFHIQDFSVTVTRSFIDYIMHQPLLFEVLGHYHHHPLHGQAFGGEQYEPLIKYRKEPF